MSKKERIAALEAKVAILSEAVNHLREWLAQLAKRVDGYPTKPPFTLAPPLKEGGIKDQARFWDSLPKLKDQVFYK
jgi:hypothetical protein